MLFWGGSFSQRLQIVTLARQDLELLMQGKGGPGLENGCWLDDPPIVGAGLPLQLKLHPAQECIILGGSKVFANSCKFSPFEQERS